MRRFSLAALIVASSTFGICPAVLTAAERSPAELVAARELFREAFQLEEAGKWSAALSKLQSVAEIQGTPQVRYHIARCEEGLGRLVSALNGFERARVEASQAGISAVVEEASQHIAALKLRIPTIMLHLPMNVEEPTVFLDGQRVSVAILAVPIPVDPGQHSIQIRAPGKTTYSSQVTAAEGERLDIEVALAQETPTAPSAFASQETPTAPSPSSAQSAAALAPPLSGPVPSPPRSSRPSTIGWILAGVGGASLVTAGVVQLMRVGEINEIDSACPSHRDCAPSLKEARDRAQLYGTLSAVSAGLGLALVGTGAYFLFRSRGEPSSPPVSLLLAPTLSSDGARVMGTLQW